MDGPFRDPGLPEHERAEYRGLVADRAIGEGVLEVTRTEAGYLQRIDARIGEGYAAELELAWRVRNGTLLAESYRLESRDGDRPVAREEGWFGDVRVLGWGAELGPYPRNVTPLLGAAVALRGLEWARGERHAFALWLANTMWWEVEVHVQRRERVTVPAGSFDAWRVRARPKFASVADALDRLIAVFLPPFTLHFDAAEPHRFLRFSFPTGPFPWNPRGLIEATALG